jgi:hypothetical protein
MRRAAASVAVNGPTSLCSSLTTGAASVLVWQPGDYRDAWSRSPTGTGKAVEGLAMSGPAQAATLMRASRAGVGQRTS